MRRAIWLFAFALLLVAAPAATAMTWSRAQRFPSAHETFEPAAVACPTVHFCAVDGYSSARQRFRVAVSTNPGAARPRWRSEDLLLADTGRLTCPSTRFCVAAGGDPSVATVYSIAPAAVHAHWRAMVLPRHLTDLTCASRTLCVGADGAGDVLTSTDPTARHPVWHTSHIDPHTFLEPSGECGFPGSACARVQSDFGPITCPTTHFCAMTDELGYFYSATRPAGGASAWRSMLFTGAQTAPQASTVSCPSSAFCAVEAGNNLLYASRAPGRQRTRWHARQIEPPQDYPPQSPICTSAAFCAGFGLHGNFYSSADPTGQTTPWKATHTDLSPYLNTFSCASAHLCVDVFTDRRGGEIGYGR